ncbi:Cuedc1 [Acrasis kona]|uniref:Cuedc1 n=1 Tax=Acrasis kona TaxID=1008807 RepID=A0AAW2Z5N8_9EUKA
MSNNRITLNDAMETLGTMFPSFDKKTLKETLVSTNGHMERTIEILLQMQDEALIQQQAPQVSSEKPKHNLPADFLCYDDDIIRNPVQEQSRKDEELARQLQRQLMLEEQQQQRYTRGQPNPHVGRLPVTRQNQPANQPTTPSAFESLSEMAKKKLQEFKDKFGGSNNRRKDDDEEKYDSLMEEDFRHL